MLRRLGHCAVATSLLFVACGRADAGLGEVERTETVPVELNVVLSGDVNLSYKGSVTSSFIVRHTTKTDAPEGTNVMGVEASQPIGSSGAAFIAGIGILSFTGDGIYTIPAGSPLEAVRAAQTSGNQPRLTSSIKVEYWANGRLDDSGEAFMRRAQPCKVVIKDRGTRGTVMCPEVTDEANTKRFSMTFSWVAPEKASSTTSTSAE